MGEGRPVRVREALGDGLAGVGVERVALGDAEVGVTDPTLGVRVRVAVDVRVGLGDRERESVDSDVVAVEEREAEATEGLGVGEPRAVRVLRVGEGLRVGILGERLREGLWLSGIVGEGEGEGEGEREAVQVDGVPERVALGVAVRFRVGDGVAVGVVVSMGVGDRVALTVAVGVRDGLGPRVREGLHETEGVGEGEGECVAVGGDRVAVGGDGVGVPPRVPVEHEAVGDGPVAEHVLGDGEAVRLPGLGVALRVAEGEGVE